MFNATECEKSGSFETCIKFFEDPVSATMNVRI